MFLMRKLVGCDVRNEDERLSGSRLLEMLGLELIEMMIRKKRLEWIAHCAEEGRVISLGEECEGNWKMNRADGENR